MADTNSDTGTTIYLKPNSNWSEANARFAIYYWDDGGSAWTDMSDTDGDGVYEGVVPSGYSNIIFCRMKPSTTINNWDNTWNQTADLTVPTDGTNCYTVAEGAWNKGSGSWSTYSRTFSVTYDLTKVTSSTTTETAKEKTEYTTTLTADTGYTLPASITVAVGGTTLTEGYAYDSTTGELTIPAASVTGDIEITAVGEAIPNATYYVAGDSTALFGDEWSCNLTANKMDYSGNGIYTKVYSNVAVGTYNLKVTNGTWENSWGDNGNNYTFVVSAACDVTVTFDSNSKTVIVSGDNVGKEVSLEITSMSAVGNGSGKWMNGKSWDVSSNAMTETSENVYEITFTGVAAGSYEYKFAANAAWTHSWGGGDTAGEAVYNGQNITLTVSYELADVTLKLDMTGYNHNTKTGATYSVTVTDVTSGGGSGGEGDGNGDASEIPEGYNAVTIHFLKPSDWGSSINAYIWTDDGALTGYEDYNTWPGKSVGTPSDDWYNLVVATEEPTAFNFIFNDGSKQTSDFSTGNVTGNTELWVVDNTIYREMPKYTATIHFQKPNNWSSVYAYVWNPFVAEGESNAIPGSEIYSSWPGTTISENASNPGWYDLTISKETNVGFNFIFNNGAGGNGNQTGNLWSDTLSLNTELWFSADETLPSSAPSGWFDPNRTIHLPGTLGGNNWDASGNQMEYDAQRGLYTITFENVTPGTYYYKVAVNGSWNENYGYGGAANGNDISVVVPSAQDVTFWYSDMSHRVVCSLGYDIDAEITLSGAGISEQLTDPELDGLYTVTVNLSSGTYSDLKITHDDSEVSFNSFPLNAGKAVTFNYDPSTGMAYHNGSAVKVDPDKICYTTKDLDYKAPFGAVATGEEVTFAITTGTDATAVSLLIKGLSSIPMQKAGDPVNGVQRWTCTTTFDRIGEYQYYFAITNGSDMVFYCDDNYNTYYKKGDYGSGTVRDINNVFPYDLVVYEAGYETPDWMKNAVIYQIFPDRFFDGDELNNQAQIWARGTVDYEYVTDWYLLPENPEMADDPNYPENAFDGDGNWSNEIYGGDLKGIVEKIDYLKALGVNVIYLNPVFWSISNHRYDAVSYSEIDPILGTLGDFEELVKIAEENDMHIILDGVFNHVSDDSVYFDRYYKFLPDAAEKYDGKIGAYPYWAYVYDLVNDEGMIQANAEAAAKDYFTSEYGITDYSYTEWFAVENRLTTNKDAIGLRTDKYVYSYEGWWGYDSMPVIYSTNGSEYQTGNWAEEIIDDGNANTENSVTEYWISKGMDGWRLDVANEVSDETWQNFRDSVKALNNSETVIIGEIWADATHYLMGDMYDSVMNYVFRDAVAGFARGYLINRDNKSEKYDADLTADEAMTILEILRERYPEEAFYAMMNLVASHDTSRILSYLDDVEDDRYQKDIAHAFPTYENTSDRAKQLQYVVAFLQFTYAGAPTIYYGDEIGMVGGDDPDDRRAFTWGKGNQEIVEWYAELAAIREAYPALRTGTVEPFSTGNNDVMGFVRSDDANTIVVLVNRATTEQSIAYEGTWVDLISGETFTNSVTVPAYRGVILVAEDEVKTITVNTEDLAPAYDSEYIVAVRHIHNCEAVETINPTCVDQGYTVYTCTVVDCGFSYTDNYVDPTGIHTWGDWTQTKAPTTSSEGEKRRDCDNCDAYETQPIPVVTVPIYTIKVAEAENGQATTRALAASAGSKITITATPDEGYVVKTIVVTDAAGNELELIEYNGKPAFVMPASKVTVTVTFLYDLPFIDVADGSESYDAIAYMYSNGLMIGTSADELVFSGDVKMTRSQIAQILYRLAGEPAVEYAGTFTDVAEGKWYSESVEWAASEGIMVGVGDGTFAHGRQITVVEMAALVYRYAQFKLTGECVSSDWATESAAAMTWCVENGVLAEGTSASDIASRYLAAEMFYAVSELISK